MCIEHLNQWTTLLELPDLQNPKNVKILRAWDGDKNSMARIKTKKVQNQATVVPSVQAKIENSGDAMDTAK